MWPSNWDEVCTLLENIGYSNPKLYWVCLDSSHSCLYAILENKEDCCPHCGKHGSITYYYLSVTNKVKRWCSCTSIAPDHKSVFLNVEVKKEFIRGPGLWKFNNTLLEDENIKTLLNFTIRKF